MNPIIEALEAHIASECRAVDVEQRYDDMLDEVYSFEKVGGPFEYMLSSRVLREVDPTAYRCGKSDWLDSEDITEVDGEYYDDRDLDEAKAAFIETKEAELSEAETALEAEKDIANGDGEPGETVNQENVDEAKATIARLRAELAELEAHSF